MASRPHIPKVFLFSAGGENAGERMYWSVEKGYAPILTRAFAGDFEAAGTKLPEGRLRAWGARASQLNLTRLGKLEPGDFGIGYAEGRFSYVARFVDDLYSPGMARQLWGDRGPDSKPLIYLFDQVERLDLDREEVLEALDYSPLFVPRGLVVPTPEHQPEPVPEMSDARDLAGWLKSTDRRRRRSPKPVVRRRAEPGPPWFEEESPASSPVATPEDDGHEPSLPDAYASIVAPPAVRLGAEFTIVVGLADRPQLEVGDSGVIPRPEGLSSYTLTAQLVASAFELRAGESHRVELPVTAENPFPTAELHLTATEPESDSGLLKVLYSVSGETVGFALRAVAILDATQRWEGGDEPPQEPSIPFREPGGVDVPDITVRIVDDDQPGYLQWTMETPWAGLETPAEPIRIKIGLDPQEFVRRMVKGVTKRKKKPDLPQYINGQAATVGAKVPAEFWDLLRACAERRRASAQPEGDPPAAAPSRPQVLLLTEDPYVPWELARMSGQPIEAGDLPYLAAQATVGRWIIGPQIEPPPPSSSPRTIRRMAVVSGEYRPQLEEASREAADLIGAFSAQRVEAKMDPLIGFLQEIGGSDVLHFAIHGSYDSGSGEGGLVLADGEVLESTSVRGLEFASKPFVFLNVCQLGAGEALLGDYAGMSGAFVHAGASGVVAPLWSIGDSSAREIAKSFYEGSRAPGGVSPAEYLRAQRAAARGGDLRTNVAYQFHGHPSMRVSI